MNAQKFFGGLLAAITICGLTLLAQETTSKTGTEKKMPPRLYELRTYTTLPGRLEALNKRFRENTMKLFEKHGMKNVMYWIPTDPEKKDNTLIYATAITAAARIDPKRQLQLAPPTTAVDPG